MLLLINKQLSIPNPNHHLSSESILIVFITAPHGQSYQVLAH